MPEKMAGKKTDEEVLDRLEEEVAREEGIKDVGPDMTTHEAGILGGHMVRKLIKEGKQEEFEKK